jgi:methyltransferase (TIGR00027 family)
MSKKGVEQKHSETAIYTALLRAIANKEFGSEKFGPDYLAQYFLPPHFRFFVGLKKIRAKVKRKFNKFSPGMNEYIIARTAYFDSVFMDALNEKVPQIVICGAGYDSRAYRFSNLAAATNIFELDAATTQHRKKKCLRKAKVNIPKSVTFVPINFNRESLRDVLGKAGFDHHKKTVFLWEGVTYYLEAESVDATLNFVSQCLHHETFILFDYIISTSAEDSDYYGAKEFLQTMKKQHGRERLMFAIEEGKIESFLKHRGLRMVENLNNEDIEKKILLDENGILMGKITGLFRFLMASKLQKDG